MTVNRCINCMEDMRSVSGSVCPDCGFDNAKSAGVQMPYAMKLNTVIHGRYLVGKVLGQGGFGITYIGFDLVLNVKVSIKEYFPMGMVRREQSRSNTLFWNPTQVSMQQRQGGNENFLKEARKAAKIDFISSMVRVRDTFFENETAYIIMDFVEGVTLKERLAQNGPMAVSECIGLLKPMMEGLSQVHKMGIIHRDISPDNIMVQPDGNLKLLDLGAAKDMSFGQAQSQLVTKKGFSPLEQYTESGQIGPWTDVYALCATIYYCITGRMISSALDRVGKEAVTFPSDLKEALPTHVEAALKAGLTIQAKDRIQSVDELLERLQGAKEEPVSGTENKKAKRGVKKVFIGGAAALLALLLLNTVASGKKEEAEKDPVSETECETAEENGEAEGIVTVKQLGTPNANLLNYGGNVSVGQEYDYFIGSDNALYVCPYDIENQAYYPDSDSEKICDHAGYITLSDTDVYFLATIGAVNEVCRMDKDGSNMEPVYTGSDGRDFQYLQYVEFSDQRRYLYFLYENKEGEGVHCLQRYDLNTKKVEMVIEGDLLWYNLYGDAVYYTELVIEDRNYVRLAKAGLDGENPVELDAEKNFTRGFIEEDTLYLWSVRDEAVLPCEPDGSLKSGNEGFYDLNIDLNSNFGYGEGWIYYTNAGDQSIHRVRANGTGDTVFLEGYSAIQICYNSDWLWFIEALPTEKINQYENHMYFVDKFGSGLMEVGEAANVWGLQTANQADFQYAESEEGDGIVITGYTGALDSFSIPDEIGGKTVVGIGESAFEESSVEEIALPEEVKTVEKNAFYKCKNLTFVGMPEGLEEIRYGAFGECSMLSRVDLPDSLFAIGDLAFAESVLSQVYIPAGVEIIGYGAFAVRPGAELMEFTVSDDNPVYFSEDGVLYGTDELGKYILKAYPSGCSGSFEIPDWVERIEMYAFAHCTGLTEVMIPESVSWIKRQAFWDTQINEITVSQSCSHAEDLGGDITVNYY